MLFPVWNFYCYSFLAYKLIIVESNYVDSFLLKTYYYKLDVSVKESFFILFFKKLSKLLVLLMAKNIRIEIKREIIFTCLFSDLNGFLELSIVATESYRRVHFSYSLNSLISYISNCYDRLLIFIDYINKMINKTIASRRDHFLLLLPNY